MDLKLLLTQEADRAQDIADILGTVRAHDTGHVQDITLAISGLNSLCWALRDLNDQITDKEGRVLLSFVRDLQLLQDSVAYTLQDVWTILGKIPSDPFPIHYREAWKEICQYCITVGRQSLHMRLENYKLFVYALCKVLQRY